MSFTIVLIPLINTVVNGTLLNFGKRYEDNLRAIFDQWPKLNLGLDALSNQKILNGIYCTCRRRRLVLQTCSVLMAMDMPHGGTTTRV